MVRSRGVPHVARQCPLWGLDRSNTDDVDVVTAHAEWWWYSAAPGSIWIPRAPVPRYQGLARNRRDPLALTHGQLQANSVDGSRGPSIQYHSGGNVPSNVER